MHPNPAAALHDLASTEASETILKMNTPPTTDHQYPDVMIDIEALADTPDSAPAEIALLFFDRDDRDRPFTRFTYEPKPLDAIHLGFNVTPGTLIWWDKNGLPIDVNHGEPLHDVLDDISRDIRTFGKKGIRVWSRGNAYDLSILRLAFGRTGRPLPWDFWNDRDVRTWLEGCQFKSPRKNNHDAAQDAENQAIDIIEATAAIPEVRSPAPKTASRPPYHVKLTTADDGFHIVDIQPPTEEEAAEMAQPAEGDIRWGISDTPETPSDPQQPILRTIAVDASDNSPWVTRSWNPDGTSTLESCSTPKSKTEHYDENGIVICVETTLRDGFKVVHGTPPVRPSLPNGGEIKARIKAIGWDPSKLTEYVMSVRNLAMSLEIPRPPGRRFRIPDGIHLSDESYKAFSQAMQGSNIDPETGVHRAILISANKPASGKSRLAAYILNHRFGECYSNLQPESEGEWNERLIAAVEKGYLFIDNYQGMIDSRALLHFLTSPEFEYRKLGHAAPVRVKNTLQIIICGNDLMVNEAIHRRSIFITLETPPTPPQPTSEHHQL